MSTAQVRVPLTICHYPFSVLRLGQETYPEGQVTVVVDLIAVFDREIAAIQEALALVTGGTVPVSVRITLRGKEPPQPKDARVATGYSLRSGEPALAGVTDGFWLESAEGGSWVTCVRLAKYPTLPISSEVSRDLAKKVAKAVLRATFGVTETELKIGRGFTTEPILGTPMTVTTRSPMPVAA